MNDEIRSKVDFCEWFAYEYRFQIILAYICMNALITYEAGWLRVV